VGIDSGRRFASVWRSAELLGQRIVLDKAWQHRQQVPPAPAEQLDMAEGVLTMSGSGYGSSSKGAR
jgi:hypothetical protein